jgi:hypothetical protein
VVDELRDTDVRTSDRETLALELRLAGASRHVDVRGWAAAQHADLASIAAEKWGPRLLLDRVPDGRWLSVGKST